MATRLASVAVPSWRRVELPDGPKVELMTAGRADADPLLFLHGWGLTPRSYAGAVVRLTAAGVRVWAPSLPGFGGSSTVPVTSGLTQYADRIAALLDALDPAKPVFVVGHSLGGGVALRLASRRPDLVRSLTLVNPVGGRPSRGTGTMINGSWTRWLLGAVTELDPREWFLPHVLPQVLRDVAGNLTRHPVRAAAAAYVALSASLADEAHALVESGVATLFVWGDRDRLTLPGAMANAVSGLGEVGAAIVKGRHGWMLSEPAEFARVLQDALVVHALQERARRQQPRPAAGALRLPPGTTLADLFPPERRHRARHTPPA